MNIVPTELLIIEGNRAQSAQAASSQVFLTTNRGQLSVEQRGDYRYGFSLPFLRPEVPFDKKDPGLPRAPRKTAGPPRHNPGSVSLDGSQSRA